ncbi:PKD domain-containing protein [Cellulomonas composti]|uniref:PKD domain-containing protein n=1 Tax=Cellulomonas composti TaxID=266130 RepID=A0A511JAG2_9CELL|nr:PKD domain-containing protein [Cellulomonas composti]GEL94977.1 hypothetical protein CCO02nite_16350 [Cellulomonas composti]
MLFTRRTRARRIVRTSVAAALAGAVVAALVPSSALAVEGTAGAVYRDEWPQLAADAFTRAGLTGWGAADAGGLWKHNASANFAVAGGTGALTVPRAGSTISAGLPSVSSTDTDMTVTVSPDKVQTGSGTHLTFVGRLVGTLEYGAKVRLTAGGAATLATVDAGTAGTAVALPGTVTPGDRLTVRLQVTGTSPTTVRAKAWRAGTAEPAAWQVTATSSTAGLQTAGGVSLSAYLSGSVTNAPLTFAYDDLAVTTTAPVAVLDAPPTAVITSSVDALTARFSGTGSYDTDGSVSSYAWTFGDGATSSSATPTHTYAATGTYPVTLTVTDNDGAVGRATASVAVRAPNVAPVASFVTGGKDLNVTVDAAGSSDPDGTLASYAWSFGDGTTGTGRTATHTYAAAGTYTVSLTVRDDEGATATTTRSVTAVEPNKPPVAAFTTAANDLDVTVDAAGSTDPDGTITAYRWSFGDGTTGTGRTATHAYAAAGVYPVTLTVTDDDGATTSTVNTVTAVEPNKAPSASFTTGGQDLVVDLDASASADPDGTLTAYAWNFGDGTTGTGRTATHTYATAGTFTVTLTVTDNRGARTSSSRTVTTTEPNKAPTAAFTSSAADLLATFDGSTSVDADGTVASYAWTFGDGTTGTGRTTSHTYTAAGTYTVALQVTDDDGATASTSRTVTVTAPVAAPLASDAFTATRSNGWGAAASGGSWTHIGAVANYSTSAGTARQVITAAGSTRTSSLAGISSLDTDSQVTVAVDKAATGGAAQVSVIGRVVGSEGYAARLKYLTDGTAQLSAMEGGTALKSISLGAVKPGDKFRVRLQVTGSSPTTVRAKAWPVASAEPADWQVSGSGTLAAYQVPGSFALSAYLAGAATSVPLTVSYQDLRVTGTSATNIDDSTTDDSEVVAPGSSIGVPAGTTITRVYDGNLTITADNTVIDGWDIHGYVTVKAKNVVIRNTYIRGTDVPQTNDLLRVQGDGYSVLVEDSTLVASTRTPNQDGVKGWNFTLRRVEIAAVIDPVHIHGSNVVVENSWLHDNAHFLEDPNWGGTPSHSDSIQIQAGTNITIRNNTISGAGNAALMLTQDAGAVANLQVTGNSIDGGACSINIKSTTNAPTYVTIADNVFGRGQIYKNCAVRVPTAWSLDMRNNVWVDGGVVARTNI